VEVSPQLGAELYLKCFKPADPDKEAAAPGCVGLTSEVSCRVMSTNSSPVATDIRVLYGDTDAMGQAYYGNYMRWFESGRAEWFRACGMSYRGLEERGVYLPVIEAHCRYRKPAFYDDTLTIATTFRFSSPARLRFDYEITRGSEEEVLASGYTVHVCVDRERKVLKPPPFLAGLLPPHGNGRSNAVPQGGQCDPAHS
jgi:acyl-CoA thioester hydrolase